uniref:ankyrin repeat-containing protein ITN1-like n=1 Tax=Erigeron canadensis TaxID=72917 RepID=UPI001CB92511|nr:ankyrin repeat-containing protein ITN1-like [Erigeron canadensis]
MAASTSNNNNPSIIVEVKDDPYSYPYPYPYPSHVIAPHFVTVKLGDKSKYNTWKTQMLCLFSSHGMLGFIDGTFVSPDDGQNEKGRGAEDMKEAWKRSDSLVKGWILGSLSEDAAIKVVNRLTRKHKESNFTAKHAWDELQSNYGPSVDHQMAVADEEEITSKGDSEPEDAKSKVELTRKEETEEDKRQQTRIQNIYWNIVSGDSSDVLYYLKQEGLAPTDKLTHNGNTTLHVAVGSSTKNHQLLKDLLDMVPTENTLLLNLVNSDGSTLLHVAAIVGNTEAASILVERNPDFLLARDKEGYTPLAVSLLNMQIDTYWRLLHLAKATDYHKTLFSGTRGDELLVLAISYVALDISWEYKTKYSEVVLMTLAQNYPSKPNFWERLKATRPGDVHYFLDYDYAYNLLRRVCEAIDTTNGNHCYLNPVFEATRLNKPEFCKDIMKIFPDMIWSTNEDGHNFIQYAVINRSENIYNLLYQMSEHKNIYKTIKDSYGNNLLHLAARLAPSNKLSLISGAALQLQRELQWFKEVEGFVRPINKIQKNSYGETPEMVFTCEHKDLAIEGEKWMKATAESYTITAALITTIVFAAAITVPGGNKDTGIPIFSNKAAFTIFAISNAISLFTAVTSLLMFLSILTTRFAEQDFLFKLPKRLIIGLAALFISTTSMIIAFGATLLLVFGQGSSWILLPIGVLTCLPITSFVTLQFPLIADLINATYFRSIFVKEKFHDYSYGHKRDFFY